MKSVRVFLDPEAMAEEIACQWYQGAVRAAKAKNIFSIVLSGGTTATAVYQKVGSSLWSHKIPWKAVHVFWADERCVSPESEESNYQTICRAFLNSVPIPVENVHRIRGEDEPGKESVRYAQEIRDHLTLKNDPNIIFDWVLLGIGMDGHTASLFPEQTELLQTKKLCEVARHPKTGQKRITLSPLALHQSNRITYHVIGSEKAEISSKLISESQESKQYPAGHISADWYLDKAAASCFKLSSD
jgi:6-phosphogluconolactonase